MNNFRRQKRDVGVWLATLFAAIIYFAVGHSTTWAVTITSDAIIDATSPFHQNRITVEDGVDGPTTVRLVEGGTVGGFELEQLSHLILDGGEVTFLSELSGSSTLTVLSGKIGCLIPGPCTLGSFEADVVATENSSIMIKGGGEMAALLFF